MRKGAHLGRVNGHVSDSKQVQLQQGRGLLPRFSRMRPAQLSSCCFMSKPTDARHTTGREEWRRQLRPEDLQRQLLPEAAGLPQHSDDKRPGSTVFIWILENLTNLCPGQEQQQQPSKCFHYSTWGPKMVHNSYPAHSKESHKGSDNSVSV